MRIRIVHAVFAAAAVSRFACAQSERTFLPHWGVSAFGGVTMSVLGSADIRHIGGLSLWAERAEPKFRSGSIAGRLVVEGDYYRSHSNGAYWWHRDTSDNFGAIVLARYRMAPRRGYGFFYEYGLGLAYENKAIYDLPSHLNSTPTFGFGLAFDEKRGEALIGLRLQHTSNARTKVRNPSQNALLLTVGIGF